MSRVLKLADDFSLPLEAATESIAIMGRKGSGKTYTGGRLFESMLQQPAGAASHPRPSRVPRPRYGPGA